MKADKKDLEKMAQEGALADLLKEEEGDSDEKASGLGGLLEQLLGGGADGKKPKALVAIKIKKKPLKGESLEELFDEEEGDEDLDHVGCPVCGEEECSHRQGVEE